MDEKTKARQAFSGQGTDWARFNTLFRSSLEWKLR